MLTRLLKDYIAEGYSTTFIELLEDWGRWARYFGCQGYYGVHASDPIRFLDDDSAMILDAAFGKLKQSRPMYWKLMRMRYVQKLDSDDIEAVLRRWKHGWSYRLNHYHLDYRVIEQVIRRGGMIVLEELNAQLHV